MSLGFGQIVVIALLLLLLFGDLPSLAKKAARGIQILKESFQENNPKKVEESRDPSQEPSSKRKDK